MAEEIFGAHAVEATVGGEESVGGEDVKARVEDEVVAEGADGDEDVGAERAEGRAVFCLVAGEEVVPAVVDELPQGGYPGDAWLADLCGTHAQVVLIRHSASRQFACLLIQCPQSAEQVRERKSRVPRLVDAPGARIWSMTVWKVLLLFHVRKTASAGSARDHDRQTLSTSRRP